jgi:hypothetical protein
MSNRSLVEINHDYPLARDDAETLRWANQILRYIGSGDPRDLPQGMTLKHYRHHSDPDPMEGRQP